MLGAKILVVDDDAAARYVIRRELEAEGAVVREAASADEAMRCLDEIDLALLDVKLPDASGFELARRIHADARYNDLPLVHMSAVFVDTDARISALETGAAAYVRKDPSTRELLAVVRSTMRLHRARTAARRLQSEGQRLLLLGRVAGRAVHEMATPLAALMLNLELLLDVPRLHEADRGILVECQRAANHLRDILTRLRAAPRDEDAPRVRISLRVALDAAVVAVSKTAAPSITFHREYNGDPSIIGSRPQLEDAFVNLLSNAMHAVRDVARERRIEVSLEVASGFARVEVRDNGVGMTADQLRRAAEPFFTTKPRGEGMGLGLSLAADAIRAHGGHIRLESLSGVGTCVHIDLPLAPPTLVPPAKPD